MPAEHREECELPSTPRKIAILSRGRLQGDAPESDEAEGRNCAGGDIHPDSLPCHVELVRSGKAFR